MNVFFIPRQPEDAKCNYMSMYYKYTIGDGELERTDLCEIETKLAAGETITIDLAPAPVIQALKSALLPPAPFIPSGTVA